MRQDLRAIKQAEDRKPKKKVKVQEAQDQTPPKYVFAAEEVDMSDDEDIYSEFESSTKFIKKQDGERKPVPEQKAQTVLGAWGRFECENCDAEFGAAKTLR